MKFPWLAAVLSIVVVVQICDCWIDSSLCGLKHAQSIRSHAQISHSRQRLAKFERFMSTKQRMARSVPDDIMRPDDSENENRSSSNRAMFPFTDWSQFIPGNISTDDQAAAGVLGMMMRAIDAGKQSSQESTLSGQDPYKTQAIHL
jgi:hypothetical protein